MVVLEYGIDIYDNANGDEDENIGTPYQAEYAEALCNEIAGRTDVCFGGTIMAYSDEWWKGKYFTNPGCPDYDPAFHSTCGYASSHPDGVIRDIKANGLDGPVTIAQGDTLIVTVALDPGANDGDPADWWLYADTPMGWYHYIASGFWVPGLDVTYSGPLYNLTPLEVWNGSGLQTGLYTICFDLDTGAVYSDCVDVTIQ